MANQQHDQPSRLPKHGTINLLLYIVLLYSGKFLWGLLFTIFVVDWQSTNIKHAKCRKGCGKWREEELLLLLGNVSAALRILSKLFDLRSQSILSVKGQTSN